MSHFSRVIDMRGQFGDIDPETGIRDGSVDAGLHCLEQITANGECWSQEEIAIACGVTNSAIYKIERKAMRKIREKLKGLGGYSF